ncbi:MAG: hypothetical protein IRZ14_07380 [Chloroflexi bacterium]|jgi:hypothetical protein|nr:hypothetical protein [Chloroflexota bacterium]
MREMDLDLEARPARELETEQPSSTTYHIDERWYQEHGISFNDVVISRMCEECQRRAAAGEETEERQTVYDPKTRRATIEVRRVPFAARPLRRIREDCSAKKGYITPDMPILEAVFRIYLANGNQPMSLASVRDQLADWCPDGQCRWLLLPLDQLERIVRHDQFYGLRPFQVAT